MPKHNPVKYGDLSKSSCDSSYLPSIHDRCKNREDISWKKDQYIVRILSLSLEFQKGAHSWKIFVILKGFVYLPKGHDLPPFVIETKQKNKETFRLQLLLVLSVVLFSSQLEVTPQQVELTPQVFFLSAGITPEEKNYRFMDSSKYLLKYLSKYLNGNLIRSRLH